VLTQIYGVTTAADASMVDALGADHIGVVIDEGIETWDSVEDAAALNIASEVVKAKLVTLSLSTEPGRVRRTVEILQPAILHLARAIDAMTPNDVAGLRAELPELELMLTVPVRGPEAIAVARRFAPVSDYLLLDTAHPVTGVVGATGLVHDWGLSASVVQAVELPVILAGGLGPANVLDAIDRVRPAGVDSETQTSLPDDHRRKDPAKVARFVELVRSSH
jgi:phosphoribosylanthranilate isomerase